MTDRLTMVTELGMLATEAVQRGDDRASDILKRAAGHLMEVHGELLKLEDRKRRDRERKPKRSSDSMESAISAESSEKGGFPPDPLSSKNSNNTTLHRARDAGLKVELVDSDGVPLALVEETDEEVAKFAKLHPIAWPAVSRFLCRRPLRVWMGWLREMRKMVGPGSQYVEEDLFATCDDDATLTSPIGSPNGLKSFLIHSRVQRMNPDQPPPGVRPINRGSTVAQRTLQNGVDALKDIA